MLNRLNRLNFMSTLLFTMFSRPFSLKYESTSRNFQPGEGLLRDCETSANICFQLYCQHSTATPQHQDNFDVFDDGGGDSGDMPAPGNIFVWLSCVEAFALNCHRECCSLMGAIIEPVFVTWDCGIWLEVDLSTSRSHFNNPAKPR